VADGVGGLSSDEVSMMLQKLMPAVAQAMTVPAGSGLEHLDSAELEALLMQQVMGTPTEDTSDGMEPVR